MDGSFRQVRAAFGHVTLEFNPRDIGQGTVFLPFDPSFLHAVVELGPTHTQYQSGLSNVKAR